MFVREYIQHVCTSNVCITSSDARVFFVFAIVANVNNTMSRWWVNWNAIHENMNFQCFTLYLVLDLWIIEWSDRIQRRGKKCCGAKNPSTNRISLKRIYVWMHRILSPEMRYENKRQRDKQQSLRCIDFVVHHRHPHNVWRCQCFGPNRKKNPNTTQLRWLFPLFSTIRLNKFSFHNAFHHCASAVWKSTNVDVVSFANDCIALGTTSNVVFAVCCCWCGWSVVCVVYVAHWTCLLFLSDSSLASTICFSSVSRFSFFDSHKWKCQKNKCSGNERC